MKHFLTLYALLVLASFSNAQDFNGYVLYADQNSGTGYLINSDANIENMGIYCLQIWLMYPKLNLQVALKFASKVANLQLANLVQKNGRPKNR